MYLATVKTAPVSRFTNASCSLLSLTSNARHYRFYSQLETAGNQLRKKSNPCSVSAHAALVQPAHVAQFLVECGASPHSSARDVFFMNRDHSYNLTT